MWAIGGKVSSEHERATAAAMFTAWALPNQPRLPGRLLVFKLGGAATVAPLSQAGAGYARSLGRQAATLAGCLHQAPLGGTFGIAA